jgi:hypothetical protein
MLDTATMPLWDGYFVAENKHRHCIFCITAQIAAITWHIPMATDDITVSIAEKT